MLPRSQTLAHMAPSAAKKSPRPSLGVFSFASFFIYLRVTLTCAVKGAFRGRANGRLTQRVPPFPKKNRVLLKGAHERFGKSSAGPTPRGSSPACRPSAIQKSGRLSGDHRERNDRAGQLDDDHADREDHCYDR